MKGRQIRYSAEELAWIEENREFSRRELHRLFVMFFGRTDVTVDHIKALCSRRGWATGRDGRFLPGQAPHNKGKPHPTRGRASETQFKKGQLPHNTRYLGHERISKDGYVEISVSETNPHTGYERRYVLKHRWLWEQANGPLPKGHCLKSLDGDKTNTDPSNWIAIPRALLPRLGGRFGRDYDNAPAELKPAILAVAQLEHAARERKRSRNGEMAA
ncbi:HNH endonuclease signature motif containing protein [Sphingomonas canadensis]|uniref:HNH endonuclease signature motif containing protein n=1 Tax=Sphingomonas canadensis TaxID=1219257 RepID=A0ABW3HCL5_9SPHN|nr:HNH endonuclease signature motif containing protein [Sphingomonas canadensis]MCW3837851.1 HNH endonuclease [Sphingomonas canadensis]